MQLQNAAHEGKDGNNNKKLCFRPVPAMKKKLIKSMLIFIFKTDSHARENFHAEEKTRWGQTP